MNGQNEDEKFAEDVKTTLSAKHKEGVEIYGPVLASYVRQCQEELKNDIPNFDLRWKPLFQALRGFDPRKRCWSEGEITHFPALLTLRQQKKKDEFEYYMLRFRIDEGTGSSQEKQMVIHQIERKKHEMTLSRRS